MFYLLNYYLFIIVLFIVIVGVLFFNINNLCVLNGLHNIWVYGGLLFRDVFYVFINLISFVLNFILTLLFRYYFKKFHYLFFIYYFSKNSLVFLVCFNPLIILVKILFV
ncbi:hypothetical protein CsatB_011710 [Cannabis sativa]